MPNIKIFAACAFTLFLSACDVPPSAALVSDYNGASVTLQENNFFGEANAANPNVISEANRICATAGNRAEYASTIFNSDTYTARHLFLCL